MATGYEPINHVFSDDYLWVAEILRKQDTNAPYYLGSSVARAGGFVASPVNPTTVRAMAEEYNEHVRTHYWSGYQLTGALSVFVAHDCHTGMSYGGYGSNYQYAFSYYGGPWIDMTLTNAGWGISGFKQVLSHEIAHTFWACDEYYPGGCFTCSYCASFGPRIVAGFPSVTNANCHTTGTGCQTHQVCIMDEMTYNLCPITAQQVGW